MCVVQHSCPPLPLFIKLADLNIGRLGPRGISSHPRPLPPHHVLSWLHFLCTAVGVSLEASKQTKTPFYSRPNDEPDSRKYCYRGTQPRGWAEETLVGRVYGCSR